MSHEVRQQALAYLERHRVMTLATSGPDGVWAAAVFYVNDGFDLYFLSAGRTRHARDMGGNPGVAAAIQEDYAEWTAVKGIQLEGRVKRLQGAERRSTIARYRAKFPFLAQAPLPIKTALKRVNWYRLRPNRLYFVDNSRGFGHRDEIPLPTTSN